VAITGSGRRHWRYDGPLKVLGELERLRVVEPAEHGLEVGVVLARLRLETNGGLGLDLENVVAIVERRLLVVKRRKAHALKVTTVALLLAHEHPHGAPLGEIDRLANERQLVDKSDGAGGVKQRLDLAHLLPRHWHVLQKFQNRMRHVFHCTKIHTLKEERKRRING
jgi:hypothetical protein